MAMTLAPGTVDQEVVDRAVQLQPLLAERAAAVDASRRLDRDVVAAMTDAGLWKLQVPHRYGGLEVNLSTKVETIAALAEGCGSTAWVAFINNICGWVVGLYGQEAQDDVWGERVHHVCGVLPPWSTSRRVEGGYVVSGRWGFASGSELAEWATLGFPVTDASGEVVDEALALIPFADVTVEDTWHVTGMRGTGSNTIVVQEAFVPDHRVISQRRFAQEEYETPHTDEVVYRASFVPQLAIELASAQLGFGRAALRLVTGAAGSRGVTYTRYTRYADSVAHQLTMAEAAMQVDTAAMHVHRACTDIETAAAAGVKMDPWTRARVRADTGWAVRNTHQAIEKLINVYGTSSFAEGNPLQRIWRDSAICGRHAVADQLVGLELFGKALAGVDDPITPLV